jgi:hypothetical protein
VLLPDGDLVIANYGAISDSGVALYRIHAIDGTVVWRASVPGLGVPHSQYEHLAYVELRGDALYVVSEASGGGFLERLSASTGSRLTRWTY